MQLVHLNTISSILPIERRFDEYVSCSLRIGAELGHRAKLHWRMLDAQFCLIDIGLEPFTGMLVALTVELYLGKLTRFQKERRLAELTYGVPAFDLSLWSNSALQYNFTADYYDGDGRFEMHLVEQDLYIKLIPDDVAYRVGWPSSFSCEFNRAAMLCGIWLHDLANDELTKLEEIFNGTKTIV